MKLTPTNNFEIQIIESSLSGTICREIATDLPEYFGIHEANERYAMGVQKRVSFAAAQHEKNIGLLSLEFPFPNNANIYWMAVLREYQGCGIGTALIKSAEDYARERGCMSVTVETLSPKNADNNYLKTYEFYEKSGYKPLFKLNTYGPDFLMIYMQKII
jgi:GNAT superfamily N-acetyltransferase